MKKLIILFLLFLIGCSNANNVPIGDIECNIDSDCSVGGCSGQLCLQKEDAQNIITTCEYREEYGCYKLNSCGCVKNKCQWAENKEFNNCLDKFK